MTTQAEPQAPVAAEAVPETMAKDAVQTGVENAADTIVARKFTVAEYYRMGEAGIFRPEERVELIEGVIVVMSPIGIRHAASVHRYIQVFSPLVGERLSFQIQNPIHLDDHTEPEPDVMLLRPRPDNYYDSHPGPEDVLLVVEVSETSLNYDRGVKAHLYGRHNIPETLVLNLPGDCIEGFTRPGPEGYAQQNIYRRGDIITLAALPDLELAVEELLPPPQDTDH